MTDLLPGKSSITSIKLGNPTGGTYTTKMVDPDTAEVVTSTWDYHQSLGDQPIRVDRVFRQEHTVKPEAHRRQQEGAKAMRFRTEYMSDVHHPEVILDRWKESVGRTKVDTVVGTGVSGTLAVVNLARDLGIDYLIVRKDTENTHSSLPVEGRLGKNWVFVDDCVSSGATFARVWDVMRGIQQGGFTSCFKGVFLYNDWEYEDFLKPRGNQRRISEWLTEGGSKTYRKKDPTW